MIESPLLREIEARGEARGEVRGKARGRLMAHVADIGHILEARFGEVPEGVRARLAAMSHEATLEALVVSAAQCADLPDFRSRLPD